MTAGTSNNEHPIEKNGDIHPKHLSTTNITTCETLEPHTARCSFCCNTLRKPRQYNAENCDWRIPFSRRPTPHQFFLRIWHIVGQTKAHQHRHSHPDKCLSQFLWSALLACCFQVFFQIHLARFFSGISTKNYVPKTAPLFQLHTELFF